MSSMSGFRSLADEEKRLLESALFPLVSPKLCGNRRVYIQTQCLTYTGHQRRGQCSKGKCKSDSVSLRLNNNLL